MATNIQPRGFNLRVKIVNCEIQVWLVDRATNVLGSQIDSIPLNKSTRILNRTNPTMNMVEVSRPTDGYRGFWVESLESIVDASDTPIVGVTDRDTFYAFLTTLRDTTCCDGCI